ncbi:hypothetical protein SLS60_010629 [Paraconiothyrium brasiliense]|uniref:Uncharacterized protein n=1 Tax=Paraconiothyrium brasiliense TaxID=300254 RepID=A0ABR3QP11_9PLEO
MKIVTSIYNTESCFLLSPEWRDIAFDNTASSLEEHLYTNVLSLLAELSVLLKDLKELNPLLMPIKQPPNNILAKQSFDIEGTLRQYLSPDTDQETANTPLTASDLEYISVPDPQMESRLRESYPLLNKAYALKSSLHTTAAQLGCHLTDGSFAQELPSYGPSNPLPTFYRFPRWRTARVYTIHWSLTILLNKTLLKLLPQRDPSRYALEAECRTVALEICKSWENAWANRPIGACHVWLGFVVAYEFCGDEVQTWVLESLNRLLEYQGVGEWKWTEEVVGLMCKRLMGEGDVLSSMGVR